MAEKYLVRTEAERFIHNDLSNAAYFLHDLARDKERKNERDGIGLVTMAGLVFSAFSIEAKVNFVGWKVLKSGWPERAPIAEKIELLNHVLGASLTWGTEPLQTIRRLFRFRNMLAHGKPDIVKGHEEIVEVEPEVWDALKMQWEADVTTGFLAGCQHAEQELWRILLKKAEIAAHETLTTGGHTLSRLSE
ncbi:hypothetical protein [Marimonas lutisalis]|uniref:hypothetical protein n=1 Tax=Marimonas lutisalis TaxID=2545756 RepID=UPI0010F838DB|nr:hypothetical protein [Marimonas lutisalis]